MYDRSTEDWSMELMRDPILSQTMIKVDHQSGLGQNIYQGSVYFDERLYFDFPILKMTFYLPACNHTLRANIHTDVHIPS